MKVVVLGASGGVGRHVVTEAGAAGHEVTVVVRSPSYAPPPGVRVVVGDVLTGVGLEDAFAGQEAVLCSIGQQRRHPANPWSSSISPPDLAERAMTAIVAAMRQAGVSRIVAVSAGGVGDSAARLNLAMRFFLATTMIGTAYRDLARMEEVLAASGLEWVCPRPTRLTNGAQTGKLRVTSTFGAMDDIARADVAAWMVKALQSPHWPDPAWGGTRTPQITRA